MRNEGEYTGGLARTIPAVTSTATILMSHIPAAAIIQEASERGVDLMLSGHTHGGQIWPFSYAVQKRFAKYIGAYDVDGMMLYVTRGAGSWGPRMRLWRPGEIIRLTLRAPH
jgi:predicted MPP superfamily phosphohydrolase